MERLHHRRWDRDRVVATCVLIFPMLLFYFLFIIKPVCTSIVYSLMKVDVVRGGVATQFLGLANFKEILRDQVFLKAAGNTIIWAIVSPWNDSIRLMSGMYFIILPFKGIGQR